MEQEQPLAKAPASDLTAPTTSVSGKRKGKAHGKGKRKAPKTKGKEVMSHRKGGFLCSAKLETTNKTYNGFY